MKNYLSYIFLRMTEVEGKNVDKISKLIFLEGEILEGKKKKSRLLSQISPNKNKSETPNEASKKPSTLINKIKIREFLLPRWVWLLPVNENKLKKTVYILSNIHNKNITKIELSWTLCKRICFLFVAGRQAKPLHLGPAYP